MRKLKNAIILICVLSLSVICLIYVMKGQGIRNIPALSNVTSRTDFDSDNVNVSASSIQKVTPTPTRATPTPEVTSTPSLKLVAVGDIMLGRSVGKRLEKNDNGYGAAFADVSQLLNTGDIVFGNLESPMTTSMHSLDKQKKIILKCSPEAVDAIKSAGFNILSLANNHMMDYYDRGLSDTIELLDKNGIKHSGAGNNLDEARKPVILEKNGIRIGFISYTDMAYLYAGNPNKNYAAGTDRAGVAPRVYEAILEDITKLRSQVDIIAVSLHWGVEETFKITPEMTEFAHKLLDNGADLILGHHPHQYQGIEIYKGKPVIYSMGNFIFDQNDPENMETFILEMSYERNLLKSLSAIPVKIIDKSRAVKQTQNDALNMMKREIELSGQLGTVCNINDNKLVFEIK